MKIDLTIGWDDLSPACKKKIEQIRKLVDKVDIIYPNINDLVWRDRTYPYITAIPCTGAGKSSSPSNPDDTNISVTSSGGEYYLQNPNIAVSV